MLTLTQPAQAFVNLYVPKGHFDSISATDLTAYGWTCDPDKYDTPLWIHFYYGSQFIGATLANVSREPAVATECGGYQNRGFVWSLPIEYRDGGNYQITAYALNIDSSGNTNGNNPPLNGSPGTVPIDVGGGFHAILKAPIVAQPIITTTSQVDSYIIDIITVKV